MKIARPRRSTAALDASALRFGAVPVLSAGRHRSPRSGACFMEFASFLAGEKWSDHPACTHPALAHLARAVNDLTTDQGRGALAPHIPEVIGLTTDDRRLELVLAVHAAAAALPEASLDRQHALAVGGLVCHEGLARTLGADAAGDQVDPVDAITREAMAELDSALEAAPEAGRWAQRFLERNVRWRRGEVNPRQSHAAIAMAVDGVRSACAPFPDERLRALLVGSIALGRRFVDADQRAATTAAAASGVDPSAASVTRRHLQPS